MTVPVQSQIFNPITGVFGTGQMQVFGPGQGGSWTVPNGIGKVRVRLWGGGNYGGGGGFALRTIYDLSGVSSVSVTVGAAGGTSSFGSYVSATGGSTGSTAGTGVGGDINSSGGSGTNGGVGSLFGTGGSSANSIPGASGANNNNGLLGSSGYYNTSGTGYATFTSSSSGMNSSFSIDFIGTGGGGQNATGTIVYGSNGGGPYGFPGGGSSNAGYGAPGLVIVEF